MGSETVARPPRPARQPCVDVGESRTYRRGTDDLRRGTGGLPRLPARDRGTDACPVAACAHGRTDRTLSPRDRVSWRYAGVEGMGPAASRTRRTIARGQSATE